MLQLLNGGYIQMKQTDHLNPKNDPPMKLLGPQSIVQSAVDLVFSQIDNFVALTNSLIMTNRKNNSKPIAENAPEKKSSLTNQPRKQQVKLKEVKSSKKKTIAKAISKKNFDALVNYLTKNLNLPGYRETLICLKAGIYTGVRPTEWSNTEIVQSIDSDSSTPVCILLKIANGKPLMGSDGSDDRLLDISNFTPQMLDICQQRIDLANDWAENGSYSKNIALCNKILREAGIQLGFTSRIKITIGTMRHLFVNNFRGTKAELATTLGHKTLETSHRNYGKKGNRWSVKDSFPATKAIPSDVENNQIFINRGSKNKN